MSGVSFEAWVEASGFTRAELAMSQPTYPPLTPDTLAVGADQESGAATGVNGAPQGDGALAGGAVYVIH